jgi:hypothetical protein
MFRALPPRRTHSGSPFSVQPSLAILLGLALTASCSKPSNSARAASTKNASSVDACALLTPSEIQQALGVAVKPGVKNTTNTASQCEWNSQDESAAVGVSVSVGTYDDVLFRTESGSKLAKPVSGYGEAAFKGFPHAGDLIIKQDGREIDLGVVDFQMAPEKLDEASGNLAKLVLSRL